MASSSNNIIKITESLQQGDTFFINFQYKENDFAAQWPSGYDMIAALYDRKWNKQHSARISDGTIIEVGGGLYSMPISHETSMKLSGSVYLEVTVTDGSVNFVDHAEQIVEMNFETRRNNSLLQEE